MALDMAMAKGSLSSACNYAWRRENLLLSSETAANVPGICLGQKAKIPLQRMNELENRH
jgi:hypothetical protein